MVKAVPPASLRVLPIAFQVHFAVIDRRVMLARNEEDLLRFRAFQHLVQCVVFSGLGCVAQVACVNNELGLLRQSMILSMVACRVPATSGFAGLLKPM